jgi:uncharacterized protein YeaO (DUF488 family)
MIEDIKVGDWVVDRMGDYCQVVKVRYMEDDDVPPNDAFILWIGEHHPDMFKQFQEQYKQEVHELDDIYGNWISSDKPLTARKGFISVEREDIVGVYPTKEVAMIHATVQAIKTEDNDD